MKTSKVLKIGFFAAAFALLSIGVYAQPTLPGDYVTFQKVGEGVDTVTVGSRMAYKVAGDPIVASMPATIMNSSIFKWDFSKAVTIKDIAGASTLTEFDASGSPKYYTAKEISVVMPASLGDMTLTINEKSRPVNGTGCEGNDSIANIFVVAKPTLQWPATANYSSCANDAVTINVPVTGYGQWNVEYTITYKPFGGTALAAVTYTATIGANGKKAGTFGFTIPAVNFIGTDGVQGVAGEYSVHVTKLTDRISRKSLDQTLVAAVQGANNTADIPSEAYVVNILPTPTTKKLQHVENMP